MAQRIGGVRVRKGSNVKWGLIGSILVGGPIYAVIEGWIGIVQLFGGGVRAAVDGISWFLATFIARFLGGLDASLQAAWLGFLQDARVFGVLTFAITVLAVFLTFAILFTGVSFARGG